MLQTFQNSSPMPFESFVNPLKENTQIIVVDIYLELYKCNLYFFMFMISSQITLTSSWFPLFWELSSSPLKLFGHSKEFKIGQI